MVAIGFGNLRILNISEPRNTYIVSKYKKKIDMDDDDPYLIMTEIRG